MRKGGSHAKGSSFERKCCKLLSLWITNGKKADCLWRSSLSGGRATVARKRGELIRQAGDICAVSPEGHSFTDTYYLECKHHKNLHLDSFIFGTGLLTKFWKETCVQAKRYDKKPMLIAKSNNVPVLVITKWAVDPLLAKVVPIANIRDCAIRKFDDVLAIKYQILTTRVRL